MANISEEEIFEHPKFTEYQDDVQLAICDLCGQLGIGVSRFDGDDGRSDPENMIKEIKSIIEEAGVQLVQDMDEAIWYLKGSMVNYMYLLLAELEGKEGSLWKCGYCGKETSIQEDDNPPICLHQVTFSTGNTVDQS